MSNLYFLISFQDSELFEKWREKIPRKDCSLTRRDKVCSLHFLEEDIKRYEKPVKLSDGTVWQRKFDRVTYTEGAIPKIFPNCPSYLSDSKKRRKKPLKRKPIDLKGEKVKRRKADTAEINDTNPVVCTIFCFWLLNL